MKENIRINFDFPREHYPDLKKICASKGISLKKFATDLLIAKIEEEEEILLAKRAEERLKSWNPEDEVDLDEAMKLSGWDNG